SSSGWPTRPGPACLPMWTRARAGKTTPTACWRHGRRHERLTGQEVLDMRVLGKFVFNLALPALLFNALAQRSLGEILNGRYLLVYAAGSLLALGLGWLWARRGA